MQYHEFLKRHRKIKFGLAVLLLVPIVVLMVLDSTSKGGRAFFNRLKSNLGTLINVYSRL